MNEKTKHRSLRLRARRGVTLIELLVVLVILTAVGGLVVPIISDALARTHFAKCSTTIPELTSQLQRSYAQNIRFPDTYDSLINDGGGLFDKIPGGDAGGQLSVATLTQAQVDGFAALGVTEVVDLDPSIDGDATWEVAPVGKTPRALADGGEVVVLDPAGVSAASLTLKRHLSDPTTQYVVFGLGNNSTATGPTGLWVEAPTHFGGEDVMNPRDVYQRYVTVFSMNDAGDVVFERAAALHPDGMDGGEAHLIGFYEETDEG